MINEELINEVIKCSKKAIKAERWSMILKNRSYRNKISLESIDGKYTYRMFIRQSSEFLEDFSVGLIWTNPQNYSNINRLIIMLRCQGPHDSQKPLSYDNHHSYHMHKITVDDIEQKRYDKPSFYDEVNKFSSFDEALCYFIKICDILDVDKHIKLSEHNNEYEQLTLDDEGG